jgi:hypothetical protein
MFSAHSAVIGFSPSPPSKDFNREVREENPQSSRRNSNKEIDEMTS